MAVINPIASKRRVKVLLVAGYRPTSLKDFLEKSVFYDAKTMAETYGEAGEKLLQYLLNNEGHPREQWKELVKLTGLPQGLFYNILRKKLLGLGMVRIANNKYYVSSEFSTMLDWTSNIWKIFTREV